MSLVEVDYMGVQLFGPESDPVTLLHWHERDRYLAIWIGAGEASELVLRDRGMFPDRPSAHDVMIDILEQKEDPVDHIELVSYHMGVYVAAIVTASQMRIDARPSDALNVARIAEVPILVDEAVLDAASVVLPDSFFVEEGEEEDAGIAREEERVDEFRKFLENIDAVDFEGDGDGSQEL